MKPAQPRTEVVRVVEPTPPGQLYVTPAGLATMFGRKKSWANGLLAEARKARSQGRDSDALCPPWRVINKCLYFKVSDVLAWAERGELYGTASYSGDHPSNRRAERELAK